MKRTVSLWYSNAFLWCLLLNTIVPNSALIDYLAKTFAALGSLTMQNTYCRVTECCSFYDTHKAMDALEKELEKNLFGQHIAKEAVLDAIGGHLRNIASSDKPLVISLHGASGTGKNYIADYIARALRSKGGKSKFVHKYLGRIDFPLESRLEEYRSRLVNDITSAIAQCPQSLFIFDEVEKMPPGLFDSIVSLLDNHAYSRHHDYRQAIFIFLSNVGGPEIAKDLRQLMQSGTFRHLTSMHDFERTLEGFALNGMGAMFDSDLVKSQVVDHFIPLLPLEKRHVESCIRKEYYKQTGSEEIEESFLNYIFREAVTMDEHDTFANNGCKRVSKKVESCHNNRLRKNQTKPEISKEDL